MSFDDVLHSELFKGSIECVNYSSNIVLYNTMILWAMKLERKECNVYHIYTKGNINTMTSLYQWLSSKINGKSLVRLLGRSAAVRS